MHRINRNIVECKGKQLWNSFFLHLRINRNIVECKVCSDARDSLRSGVVLIETLWNVKFVTNCD